MEVAICKRAGGACSHIAQFVRAYFLGHYSIRSQHVSGSVHVLETVISWAALTSWIFFFSYVLDVIRIEEGLVGKILLARRS